MAAKTKPRPSESDTGKTENAKKLQEISIATWDLMTLIKDIQLEKLPNEIKK